MELRRELRVWFWVQGTGNALLGFCAFMFDVEDRRSVCYCYEIQLRPDQRGRGVGVFLMEASARARVA
jgi:GNAT superfamily N-acetyltransferase